MKMLKFSRGNAKLSNDTLIFDLPAGHSCPAAKTCLAFAHKKTGKIKDGKDAQIRCYAASQEWLPNVREKRWNNFNALKNLSLVQMIELIESSILKQKKTYTSKVRIHSSGDFFSRNYFLAWVEVARSNKDLTFYCYTKSVHLVKGTKLPTNFVITFSYGGKYDYLIENNDKTAKIVFSEKEAKDAKLKIDHTDKLAYQKSKKPFALLLHGQQKAKSAAAHAKKELKKVGFVGYSK